jgi:hypothetical protein
LGDANAPLAITPVATTFNARQAADGEHAGAHPELFPMTSNNQPKGCVFRLRIFLGGSSTEIHDLFQTNT